MNSSEDKSSRIEPKEQFSFRELSGAHYELTIDPKMPYFEGHFPGNPVLPGVAILDAALEVIRLKLKQESPPFVKKLIQAKYTGLIKPRDVVLFSVSLVDVTYRVLLKKAEFQVADIIFEI
jgi:3-hydroxymyristoyl/3-hydroxydecanoyl-(acyl carrier protein) dehydratase